MADLSTTMTDLVACVCDALADIDRPTCDCGLTVGSPVAGPQQCCECVTGASGQVAGFLERTYAADGVTLEPVTRFENCRPGPIAADISIVVTRCYPTMDERGNMPALDATTEAADNLNSDLAAAWNGLLCCGMKVAVREAVLDADPEGGCAGFAVRVTVLVSLPANPTGDIS